MRKNDIKELAHIIANKMNMPYCWEDVYNRIIMGIPLPIRLEEEKIINN